MDKINGQRVNGIMLTHNKDKTQLTINVSVEPFSTTDVEVKLTTKDILNYLNEKQKKVGKCLESSVISNKSEKLFGSWVSELEQELKPQKKKIESSQKEE